MAYQDRSMTCSDCGSGFTFTVREQEFYESKGFTSEPRRCPDCRAARKAGRNDGGGYGNRGGGGGYGREDRVMHDAVCAECGKETQVPFVPTGSRPVYCSDCFRNQRGGDSRGRSYQGNYR